MRVNGPGPFAGLEQAITAPLHITSAPGSPGGDVATQDVVDPYSYRGASTAGWNIPLPSSPGPFGRLIKSSRLLPVTIPSTLGAQTSSRSHGPSALEVT